MRKIAIALAVAALGLTAHATAVPDNMPEITWETLGNACDHNGLQKYVQRFTVKAPGGFEKIGFCTFKHPMVPVNPLDTLEEILPGYYAVRSGRFTDAAPGDVLTVDIVSDGALTHQSFVPDGMHLVVDGKPVRARTERKSIMSHPWQWRTQRRDGMIYGDEAWRINDSLLNMTERDLKPYMQIPSPKSVRTTGRYIKRPKLKAAHIEDPRHDYYSVELRDGTATVYTNSRYPEQVLRNLERRLDMNSDSRGRVPAATIRDWADYGYRGYMIDVARNFQSKEDVMKMIDVMARYDLNMLHFHLGDDEGWRLEIPAVPELTQVGGHRGYAMSDDVPWLKGIYSGDGSPEAKDTPANGFYTVDDYIEILRYAADRGIEVLPEFDSPGHSRAAIRATEWRYRHNGDASLRLIEDGDTSRYETPQNFTDDLMNPALPGPYKLWGIVFDTLKDIHARAGVPLPGVHIGGDEVPAGAWSGSPAVRKLMHEQGMTEQREVHAWFVDKVCSLAAERGLKVSGWQEVAMRHSPEYDAAVRPVMLSVNSWTNAGNQGYEIASKGYPLVLTNVDYLYFDQTPNSHPEEPGLVWGGGKVDEFKPLHATLDNLCPGDTAVQSHAVGISGTNFAETVRSRQMLERYMLPRVLGLAERAHNANATISDGEYFGHINREMDFWVRDGRDFYLRQPGIRVNDGRIEMNKAYAGHGEIRYTLDGTDPTLDSPLYTGSVSLGESGSVRQIRARLFSGPRARSVVSILYL